MSQLSLKLKSLPSLTVADASPGQVFDLPGLQRLVGGSLTESDGTASAILISEANPPFSETLLKTGIAHTRYDREKGCFFRRFKTPAPGSDTVVCWRMALLLGIISRIINGDPVMLMHGTLLETEAGHAIFLCGQSGMGKSTTARRWKAYGGTCHADDMVLMDYSGETLMAYPLPTWSRCIVSVDGEYFPFEHAVPVKHIVALDRGTVKEELRSGEHNHFMLSVYASCCLFLQNFCIHVIPELKTPLIDKMKSTALMLNSRYEHLCLFAVLQANLKKTLEGLTK